MRPQAPSSPARRRAAAARPSTSRETQAMPKGASAFFSASGSRGNLLPSSMPSKPASLASARHTSSGVSPPSSSMSSLDQPMGLAPIRIVMLSFFPCDQSPTRCAREGLFVSLARPSFTCGAHATLPAPPRPTSGRPHRWRCSGSVSMTMTVVRSRLRALPSGRPRARRCRRPSSAIAPEACGMGGEVDRRAASRVACAASRLLKLSPPVARCRRLMQPIAAIVEQHDGELEAEHHRGGELGIHHQVGAVAHHHDHFAVGIAPS